MKLILDGVEEIECTKAVKGVDYLHVYDGDNLIWSFEGVNGWDGYVLEGGEFSDPEPTELQKMQAQIDMLMNMLAEKEG